MILIVSSTRELYSARREFSRGHARLFSVWYLQYIREVGENWKNEERSDSVMLSVLSDESSILEKENLPAMRKSSSRLGETQILRKSRFLQFDAIFENLHFVWQEARFGRRDAFLLANFAGP